MKKKILLGSIIAVLILLGITFSSVVAVKDIENIITSKAPNFIEYISGSSYWGLLFIVGICDDIYYNDTFVDISVGSGRLVLFLIGSCWYTHYEWLPFIGFMETENIREIEIYNFKGIIKNKFILGIGKIDGYYL